VWDPVSFLALPALACAALVAIHAYFGLHVLRRNVVFVDLALAQVAALGATVAFLVGHAPQGAAAHAYAAGFTLAAAALLASSRSWSARVPQEAQIGVIYVVAAAAALLIVDRAPQGAEHIRQILTGNILTVGWDELRWAIALYAIVGAVYPVLARRLDPASWRSDFAFYAAFGLVVTSSVALAGVLLVFAFLIVPAAIGVLHADTFRRQLVIAWIAGTATSLVGLAISYAADLSTGATLVCAYGVALMIAGLVRALRGAARARLAAAGRGARLLLAGLLAVSGLWIVASPAADQPVLDAIERVVPSARSLYIDDTALATANEARQYAARYRSEAEALRKRESESRWNGSPIPDEEVRRIASFLKSYNEMIRGEEFVVREVRNRARAAHRFALGAAFLLAAALLSWPRLYASRT